MLLICRFSRIHTNLCFTYLKMNSPTIYSIFLFVLFKFTYLLLLDSLFIRSYKLNLLLALSVVSLMSNHPVFYRGWVVWIHRFTTPLSKPCRGRGGAGQLLCWTDSQSITGLTYRDIHRQAAIHTYRQFRVTN